MKLLGRTFLHGNEAIDSACSCPPVPTPSRPTGEKIGLSCRGAKKPENSEFSQKEKKAKEKNHWCAAPFKTMDVMDLFFSYSTEPLAFLVSLWKCLAARGRLTRRPSSRPANTRDRSGGGPANRIETYFVLVYNTTGYDLHTSRRWENKKMGNILLLLLLLKYKYKIVARERKKWFPTDKGPTKPVLWAGQTAGPPLTWWPMTL